jgi:hypothetical protein
MTPDALAGEAVGLEGSRVVAVRWTRAVDEATVRPDGSWELAPQEPVDRVVFQLTGDRLGAVAVAVEDAGTVAAPRLATLALTLRDAAPGAAVWLDPEALEGFPDELLEVLRTHPDGTVDLHVGAWTAHEPSLTIAVQPGRYRLSGGLIALHPTSSGQSVAGLRPAEDGPETVADETGEVTFEVTQDAGVQLRFTSARGAR